MSGLATLAEHDPRDYAGRRYQRLNEDYQPMHALGRFIVEHAGPRHVQGSHTMVPFLLDMNQLYERFVASWLGQHLPTGWLVEAQDHLAFGSTDPVHFFADLVLRDRTTGTAVMVLDTKHKRHTRPSADDVAQVVAYAAAWGTTEAVLIYPEAAPHGWVAHVGGVRVRALTFALSEDLDLAGATFLERLLPRQDKKRNETAPGPGGG